MRQWRRWESTKLAMLQFTVSTRAAIHESWKNLSFHCQLFWETKMNLMWKSKNSLVIQYYEIHLQNFVLLRDCYKVMFQKKMVLTKRTWWNLNIRWKESWEGLLVVTHVSTSWVEVVFRVKWQLEIQTSVVLLWSVFWLVVEREIRLEGRMVRADWFISIGLVSEGCSS